MLKICVLIFLLLASCDSALRSLYGSFQRPNPDNCRNDPSICQSLSSDAGAAVCDVMTSRCISAGRCEPGQIHCASPELPLCTPEGVCTPCGQDGDTLCQTRATDRQDRRVMCLNGACVECRTQADCQSHGDLSVCDGQSHLCRGCTSNAECPSSGVCRTDLPSLGPVASTAGYRCASLSEIAYVDSTAGLCSPTGPGTLAAPYCQLTQAVAANKTLLRIQPWTAQSANYAPLSVDTDNLALLIIGPGRDSTLPIRWEGLGVNKGKVTVTDVAVQRDVFTQPVPFVSCSGGEVALRRVLVRGGIKGVIGKTGCVRLTLERTRLESVQGEPLVVEAGTYRVVNSAIVDTKRYMFVIPKSVTLGSTASGIFAFNTLDRNFDGIDCQGGQLVTDSIVNTPVGVPSQIKDCQLARTAEQAQLDTTNQTLREDAQNTSCCIDKGLVGTLQTDAAASSEIAVDYFGNPRPARGGLDVGYHELP